MYNYNEDESLKDAVVVSIFVIFNKFYITSKFKYSLTGNTPPTHHQSSISFYSSLHPPMTRFG